MDGGENLVGLEPAAVDGTAPRVTGERRKQRLGNRSLVQNYLRAYGTTRATPPEILRPPPAPRL
jgi:hypothetical protein